MDHKSVVQNIFGGGSLNPVKYYAPVEHRYSVVHRSNAQVVGSDLPESHAHALADMMRLNFGGHYDIIETDTVTSNGKRLFSGEISQDTPHVVTHDPIDDPMAVEYYMFDVAEWITSLVAERTPLSDEAYSATKDMLPVAPVVRVRKPRKSRDTSREREYASISDDDILHNRGYVVIDLRNQERLFSGTKELCIEYIMGRNKKYSRDRIPVECLKVVPFSEYGAYQENVEANGKVVRYRGNVILIGLQGEVEAALRKMIKKLVNPRQHLRADDVSVADLWWVQNRLREV